MMTELLLQVAFLLADCTIRLTMDYLEFDKYENIIISFIPYFSISSDQSGLWGD
jgi:hypothetical protein